MSTPDDQVLSDVLPLLTAAADPHAPAGRWLVFATDQDTQLAPAVRWALADPSSPLAGTPAHGRRAAIQWAAPGGWTAKAGQDPIRNGTGGRIGRIRLRTPRPTARKDPSP